MYGGSNIIIWYIVVKELLNTRAILEILPSIVNTSMVLKIRFQHIISSKEIIWDYLRYVELL